MSLNKQGRDAFLDVFSFVITEVEEAVGEGIVVGEGHDFAADFLHHFLIDFRSLFGVQPFLNLIGKPQRQIMLRRVAQVVHAPLTRILGERRSLFQIKLRGDAGESG